MSKTGLPSILTCTKTDTESEEYVTEWMNHETAFVDAVTAAQPFRKDGSDAGRLLVSMGYVQEEFGGQLDVRI